MEKVDSFVPASEKEWKLISDAFYETWNIPHCVGTIDGKHIAIQCPNNSGSLYFNYKAHFIIVLTAICNANYLFSYVDIGSYGSNNDAVFLKNSKVGDKFENNEMGLPEAVYDDSFNMDHLPYYLVAIFSFIVMKPYVRKKYKISGYCW